VLTIIFFEHRALNALDAWCGVTEVFYQNMCYFQGMKILEEFEHGGKKYQAEYEDCDDFSNVPDELWRQHYGVCFLNGKIILGLHGHGDFSHWKIIGGTREVGENARGTLVREIFEESNMEVLEYKPIGFQKVKGEDEKIWYQLRSWCKVKPLGEFVSDPDSGVTEIKLIDPKNYKKYFDWGKIGERIIQRAVEINTNQD